MTSLERKQMWSLHKQGYTRRQLAEHFSVTPKTIRQAMEEKEEALYQAIMKSARQTKQRKEELAQANINCSTHSYGNRTTYVYRSPAKASLAQC